jgi:hypothetical protein
MRHDKTPVLEMKAKNFKAKNLKTKNFIVTAARTRPGGLQLQLARFTPGCRSRMRRKTGIVGEQSPADLTGK